jgi:hypothetical protein
MEWRVIDAKLFTERNVKTERKESKELGKDLEKYTRTRNFRGLRSQAELRNMTHFNFPFALHLTSLPGTSRDVCQSIAKVLPVTCLSHSIFDVSSLSKQQANNEALTHYYVSIFLFFCWADTDHCRKRSFGVTIRQAPIVVWLYTLVHLPLIDTISSISCNSDDL